MQLLRIFLTFPIFLLFNLSFTRKKSKFRKNSQKWNEEKRYKWTKWYARYLFWLTGTKIKLTNSSFWNEEANVVFCKTDTWNLPLLFAKSNKFDSQSPFIFAFPSQKALSSQFLVSFFAFTRPLYLDSHNQSHSDEWVKKIKIPRTVFYFYKNFDSEEVQKMLFLASGAYTRVTIANLVPRKKGQQVMIKEVITATQIVSLDSKFLEQKISQT